MTADQDHDASNGRTREPRPGEKCVCGQPAKIVFIHKLGDVPACRGPADYAEDAEHFADVAITAIRRAMGQ